MGPLAPVSALGGPALDGVKELFDVNFFSLVSIISHALPHLRRREGKEGLAAGEPAGRIVLVSSGAATGGVTGWAAYKCVPIWPMRIARMGGQSLDRADSTDPQRVESGDELAWPDARQRREGGRDRLRAPRYTQYRHADKDPRTR